MLQAGTTLEFGDITATPESEVVRRRALADLHSYFSKLTTDQRLAKRVAVKVHNAIEGYRGSFIRLKVRRSGGAIHFVEVLGNNAAVPALRRLARARGSYAWAKAWTEMGVAASRAIIAADRGDTIKYRNDPIFFAVPIQSSVKNLIEPAIEIARKNAGRLTTAKPERDRAVVAILRAYAVVKGARPTAKPASRVIADVEKLYAGYLDRSFGVLKSKATLQKLVAAAAA